MTSTMTHAASKTKAKLKDPEFLIKVGSSIFYGGMILLSAGLAVLFLALAMGPLDILLGLIFVGCTILWVGFFMEALQA